MTDLLIRDPNDTGDIPAPDLVDTHIIFRRPDATVELQRWEPADLLPIQGPQSPPPPIPPNPGPVLPPKPKGWLRRLAYVGQHRADRSYRWSIR
jgi:hypothetical protein